MNNPVNQNHSPNSIKSPGRRMMFGVVLSAMSSLIFSRKAKADKTD